MVAASNAASEQLAQAMTQAHANLILLIGKMNSGGKSAGNVATEWDGVTEALGAAEELCDQ